MIEGISILVSIAVVGALYWICSMLKHDTCDMGKLFTVILAVVGLVTGCFLYVHAFAFLRTSKEDAAWGGIAGFILTIYSLQQVVVTFRELFAKAVAPLKCDDESTQGAPDK